MAATLQHVKVSCRGGLDLRSNSQELLSRPGYAQQLDNFECVHRGGYRRIAGYTPYGINPVPGSGAIKGLHIFNDSILVARGEDLYHSFDASTWVQVNKVVSGANLSTIQAASATLLDPSAEYVEILPYSHGTAAEEQIVTIVNGYDDVMVFTVAGDNHNSATYSFEFLDQGTTAAPTGSSFGAVFKDQVYLSGDAANPSSIYISTLTDPTTYNATNSAEIATADPVKGLKPFRDSMIVFCENSVWSLSEANTGAPNLQAITTDIGCISGRSVQEVNGDLVFLAPDGLRTLAATDRIDDVELSTISSQINPLIEELLLNIDQYNISSIVLREKNQYRLYFPYKSPAGANDIGLIGTIVRNTQGQLEWNWSKTKGMAVDIVDQGLKDNKFISLMASRSDGILYQHDTGPTFNGTRIMAAYRSPYFDIGDPSIRKNIHRVRTYIKPEGKAEVSLGLRFSGYGNENTQYPATYALGELRTPASYGLAEYNNLDHVYGAKIIDTKVVNTEGSGFTISVLYKSDEDTDYPYNIQGYDLDFIASGKV